MNEEAEKTPHQSPGATAPPQGEAPEGIAEDGDDGFDEWWQRKTEQMRYMQVRSQAAERWARERRWRAPGKSTVKHPKYGQVVVPHDSCLAAIYNAEEYWKVPEEEHRAFIENVEVWQYQPGDGPLRRPREFCQKQ